MWLLAGVVVGALACWFAPRIGVGMGLVGKSAMNYQVFEPGAALMEITPTPGVAEETFNTELLEFFNRFKEELEKAPPQDFTELDFSAPDSRTGLAVFSFRVMGSDGWKVYAHLVRPHGDEAGLQVWLGVLSRGGESFAVDSADTAFKDMWKKQLKPLATAAAATAQRDQLKVKVR